MLQIEKSVFLTNKYRPLGMQRESLETLTSRAAAGSPVSLLTCVDVIRSSHGRRQNKCFAIHGEM